MEKTHVSGVAKDKNVARLALIGLADEPGTAFKIFSLLAKKKINVDIILQSIGREETKDISFTVARGDAEEAKKILEENQEYIGFKAIEMNTQVAKVSIVGAAVQRRHQHQHDLHQRDQGVRPGGRAGRRPGGPGGPR